MSRNSFKEKDPVCLFSLTPNSALYSVGKCVYLGTENVDFKASGIGSQISRDM